MRAVVAFVICALLTVPASASATSDTNKLLRAASRLSGLPVRRPVPVKELSGKRYEALVARSLNRSYPQGLQRTDARLYGLLGLGTDNRRQRVPAANAWYDPATRTVLLRRAPKPARARVIHEFARALIDQHFGLRRLDGLRARDRDGALAAGAILDGAAALASGLRPGSPSGTPLDRFVQLDREVGLGAGRALGAELRYLGGHRALATALRTFPQTTEQLLHIDKFLERERARPIRLAARIGDGRLTAAETFGELDARNLLEAFALPKAIAAAAGWGGGRIGLYDSGHGQSVAALVLRWDTAEDAREWRDAIGGYIAVAFPGAVERDCPPLDRCWATATTEVAAGMLGETSVIAAGSGSSAVASALLRSY